MPLKRSSSNTRPHVSPKHCSWKQSRMSFLCLVSPQICSSGKSIKQNYNYCSKKNLLIKSQIIFSLLYLKMLARFGYFRRRGPHHLTTVACQEGFTGAGRERDSPDSSIRNRQKGARRLDSDITFYERLCHRHRRVKWIGRDAVVCVQHKHTHTHVRKRDRGACVGLVSILSPDINSATPGVYVQLVPRVPLFKYVEIFSLWFSHISWWGGECLCRMGETIH